MDNYITTIALTITLIISIISANFFFSITKITLDHFLTINVFPLINAMISFEFIMFLIFVSLSIACILLIIKHANLQYALGFSLVGYVLGVTLGTILFGNVGFLVPLLLAAGGIPLAFESLIKKEKEYKSLPTLRSGISAANKIIILSAVGLLIFILVITFPAQDIYEQRFATQILSTTIGDAQTFGGMLQTPMVKIIVDSQKQTLNSIKKMPGFNQFENKNDADVLTFVTNFNTFDNMVNSDTYITTITDQFAAQTENQELNKQLLEQIPIINEIAKLAWLLYAIEAFILVMFIGNLIVKNLAGLMYILINYLVPGQKTLAADTEDNPYY
ncbi:MAG: hypothetical protein WC915_00520 [archaeon]|jgi:hypothetical protein